MQLLQLLQTLEVDILQAVTSEGLGKELQHFCVCRKKGIGSRLVGWVVEHARKCRCRAACLHVIDYNTAAMALYRAQGFQEIACRENFYHIT